MYNPLRTKFWCQQKSTTLPVCCKFQNNLFEVWFYTHYNDFIHVYRPRAGTDNPLGTKFDVNRKALSLCPCVANFNKISFKSNFIHIFHDLIYVYNSGQGPTTPWEQNIDVNRKALSLCPFVAKSFKNISLKTDFIHIFQFFYTCI